MERRAQPGVEDTDGVGAWRIVEDLQSIRQILIGPDRRRIAAVSSGRKAATAVHDEQASDNDNDDVSRDASPRFSPEPHGKRLAVSIGLVSLPKPIKVVIRLGDLGPKQAHRGNGGQDQRAAKELKTGHRFSKQDPGENSG